MRWWWAVVLRGVHEALCTAKTFERFECPLSCRPNPGAAGFRGAGRTRLPCCRLRPPASSPSHAIRGTGAPSGAEHTHFRLSAKPKSDGGATSRDRAVPDGLRRVVRDADHAELAPRGTALLRATRRLPSAKAARRVQDNRPHFRKAGPHPEDTQGSAHRQLGAAGQAQHARSPRRPVPSGAQLRGRSSLSPFTYHTHPFTAPPLFTSTALPEP